MMPRPDRWRRAVWPPRRVTEFVGIGTALELFGISKYIAVPISALVLWYLVIAGTYTRVEKLFLVLTLVFFAYPAARFSRNPTGVPFHTETSCQRCTPTRIT
jgi:Mn2+/Fe2+ NRAMP family transporter